MNGKWRAYFELLRFPALFTAIADVMMGYLVTHGSLRPYWQSGLLITASAAMYLAGMVLNDVFDSDVDASERPHRPIPSGRILLPIARRLGLGLLTSGLFIAFLTAALSHSARPVLIGVFLASFIFLYDDMLKRTSIAPLVMGCCRLFNVLLGMSLAAATDVGPPRHWTAAEWLIAAGIGSYVVGVTLFAQSEATKSAQRQLAAGLAIMLIGIGIIATAPIWNSVAQTLELSRLNWALMWCLLAMVIARRCVIAMLKSTPQHVQQAVRVCLRSIIVINAAITLGYCGPIWGTAILALLVPMTLLERRFSTT